MRGILSSGLVLGALAVAVSAQAAPKRRVDFPCPGCLFDPPSSTPAPLLVVLHGDAPGTVPDVRALADVFSNEAAARGIAVFAPRCPVAEGCSKGSWWQWDAGDPRKWLEAQLKAIEATVDVDPDRVWIAGWSGGASYLGWWSSALDGRFAAVAYLGGGMPPAGKSCTRCALPTTFVVGDQNPLHHLAVGLRDHHVGCGDEVRWDLHAKADHGGEWSVVRAKPTAPALLDWFAAHPRRCPIPALSAAPSTAVASSSATSAAPSGATPLVTHPSAGVGRCGCSTPGAEGSGTVGLSALFAVAGLRRTRRRA